MSENAPSRSARRNLLAMAAIAFLPPVIALLLYLTWTPGSFVNYGELIKPLPLSELQPQTDTAVAALAALKGKWVLVSVDSGACDEYCRRKLYIIRQLRLTQGKDMERIERAWLLDDEVQPVPALEREYVGTLQIRASRSALMRALPVGGALRDHIYLIDPLGNVMLRYPRDPEPNRMKKDLSRLLRASRIG